MFSSISSFFGSQPQPDSSNRRQKSSVFGSGYPSASRRGPPGRIESDAWQLPYSTYSNAPGSPGAFSPRNSQYPPTPNSGQLTAGSSGGGFGAQRAGGRGANSPYGSSVNVGTRSGTTTAAASVADFTNMHPSASSSHLVNSLGGGGGGGGGRIDARSSTGVSIPSTAYPPLRHTWNRIRSWCDSNYEELADTFNWPATELALDELEMTIGFALPSAVRESYLCIDGQELESNQSCSDGLFFGLALLSVEQVSDEWKFWRNVDDEPSTGSNPEIKAAMTSCPDKWVRPEYSHRGWIPLITDHVGNYIGIDLSPHPSGNGSPGQVIIFGRDFDTKIVLWRGEGEGGWGRFLQVFAEELEQGEMFSLEDDGPGGSSGEEDGIGYESYFSNGGSGASKGGGDRAGDGAASFKLIGEYKGWPVLDAWADRSVRNWEEVGLFPGRPNWQLETPSVRIGLDSNLNEHGENLDAEGSSSRSSFGGINNSNNNGSSSSNYGSANEELVEDDGRGTTSTTTSTTNEPSNPNSHPLASSDSTDSTIQQDIPLIAADDGGENLVDGTSSSSTTTSNHQTSNSDPRGNNQRRISDTLSPPLPSTRASRKQQKSREESPSPSFASFGNGNGRNGRRAPPPMASPIDLPTIADVRASHAAALAENSKSAKIQVDYESNYSNGYQHENSRNSSSSYRDNASSTTTPTGSRFNSIGLGVGNIGGGGGRRKGDDTSLDLELENRSTTNASTINGSSVSSFNDGNHSYGIHTAESSTDSSGNASSSRSTIKEEDGSRNSNGRSRILVGPGSTSPRILSPRNSVSSFSSNPNGVTPQSQSNSGADSPSLIDANSAPSSPSFKSIGLMNPSSNSSSMVTSNVINPSPLASSFAAISLENGGKASSKDGTTTPPPRAAQSPSRSHSRTNSIKGVALPNSPARNEI